MSSFKMVATHKATGKEHDIWCFDDCFGKHEYGYLPNIEGGKELTEVQFYEQYSVEDK